ncbi:MAG: hypothetical protein RBU37_05510 [Myxococcota bacterium]|jgi:hypothetical protein|nr:hypothetical protein [Myxococcota bacterium]
MRILGILLIVLGLGAAGAGVYGHLEMQANQNTIDTNTAELKKILPEDDLTDIKTLVAIDRVLKEAAPPGKQDLAWDILNAMGDIEDNTMLRNVGFGAGGGLLLIGILLAALGGKKKKADAES